MKKYDAVIIGGGISGLICATILSKEGKSVCLLEQHRVIGGCLQSFKRNGRMLDTGMHYVGSMKDGQIMNQYFKYFGILDKLNLRKMDDNGFDVFRLRNGGVYRHATGYDNFLSVLSEDFPQEREGLKEFCRSIKAVGDLIAPDVLDEGKLFRVGNEYMGMSAYEEICRCVENPDLRSVLGGNNGLYAGNKATTSLYEYAMITHSNIEGPYCFAGGTQHIADAFVEVIKNNGGEVYNNMKVSKIHIEDGSAEYVETADGERFYCSNVISTIHPAQTLSFLENNHIIKKAFMSRVNDLPNSYGIYTTYLLLKPKSMKFLGSNQYCFNNEDVWNIYEEYKGWNMPMALMCMQPNLTDEYSEVATLLTPMPKSMFSKWENTDFGDRGSDYYEFKEQYNEVVIDFICKHVPQLRSSIEKVYSASPLTYRDYTSSPDGSAYGIVKDYHNPIVSHLSPRTKIQNLFITGQNLNVHGCLGTCVSSAFTSSLLIGESYLAGKIAKA